MTDAEGWVCLGPVTRRHLTEALLAAPAVRAMLAAAAETGGAAFPPGIALAVELEIAVARVRLIPEAVP